MKTHSLFIVLLATFDTKFRQKIKNPFEADRRRTIVKVPCNLPPIVYSRLTNVLPSICFEEENVLEENFICQYVLFHFLHHTSENSEEMQKSERSEVENVGFHYRAKSKFTHFSMKQRLTFGEEI